EPALLRLFAHLCRNVQPRQWRLRQNILHCRMNCVVRTDQEIGAGPFQPVRGAQHQLRHALPVLLAVQKLHVFGQADGMHRHFRMRMLSHQSLSFQADGSITERRSFCTAPHEADVLAHFEQPGIVVATLPSLPWFIAVTFFRCSSRGTTQYSARNESLIKDDLYGSCTHSSGFFVPEFSSSLSFFCADCAAAALLRYSTKLRVKYCVPN